MPVGTREALLIIRAQDLASSVLNGIGATFGKLDKDAQKSAQNQLALGAAITTAGLGITTIGAAGLKFYSDSAKAAMEYNAQASLTLTQTQGLGITLKQVEDAGKATAKAIPVPFKETQTALYDIFSSMDVNMTQAGTLLNAFSKGAVAGQVSLQDSSRATIGLMNAFKVPVQDVNKILDFQFQLVKEGVGTYQEFATTIGRVSPSAVKAGQDINTMGGMLAFLTRNGLNAASASAAAARALDSVSNPMTIEHFAAFGLSIKNAAGEFKPMTQIVQELAAKLGTMTAPDRAAALHDLFKSSGGTIQAMRFWNLAITNTKEFVDLTNQFPNAAGQMDKAYQTMFVTPQSQMQLFKNNIDIIKTDMGEPLLGTINKFLQVGIKLAQWFEDLSPHTQKMIGQIGLLVASLTTIIGVVVTLAGMFIMLSAGLTLIGVSFGVFILVIGGVVAGIVAISVAVYLLITHWKLLRDTAGEVWSYAKQQVAEFLNYAGPGLKTFWKNVQQVTEEGVNIVLTVFGYLIGFWNTILFPILGVFGSIFGDIFNTVENIVLDFWDLIQPILKAFTDVFNSQILPALQTFWTVASAVFNAIGAAASWLWNTILYPFLHAMWEITTTIIIPALQLLGTIFGVVFNIILVVVQIFWAVFSMIIQAVVGLLMFALKPVVEYVAGIFVNVWNNIGAVVRAVWDNVLRPVWNAIVDFWNSTLFPVIRTLGKAWSDLWNGVASAAKNVWPDVRRFVVTGINELIDIINNMIRNVQSGLNSMADGLNSLPGVHVGTISIGAIPKLHSGGLVTGYQDEVLRILLTGEGVLNRQAMSNVGTSGLNQLNSGGAIGATMIVQPGAIQIIVQGGGDNVAQQVEEGVSSALNKMYNELRSK